MRTAVLVLAALAALPAAGCKSTESEAAPPQASTYDGEGKPKIKFGDGGTGSGQAPAGSSGPGVFDYAMIPFENVVYLPWKLVGGGLKGASDGVRAGFAKDRMPFLATLFSPINAVAGFLTGAGEGVAMSPGVVGPSDNFSYAMGRPLKHATTIWWYE